jgi:hypothetical protein
LLSAEGSFVEADVAAAFQFQLPGSTGACILTGQAVSGADSLAGNTGVFTLAGIDATLSQEFLGGGGRIQPGGQFSRRRWRELQDELIAAHGREARQRADRERRRREAARTASLAEKAARQAARELNAQLARAHAEAQAIEDAQRALLGAQDIARTAQYWAARSQWAQAANRRRDQDEDEALALLLAA